MSVCVLGGLGLLGAGGAIFVPPLIMKSPGSTPGGSGNRPNQHPMDDLLNGALGRFRVAAVPGLERPLVLFALEPEADEIDVILARNIGHENATRVARQLSVCKTRRDQPDRLPHDAI